MEAAGERGEGCEAQQACWEDQRGRSKEGQEYKKYGGSSVNLQRHCPRNKKMG